MYEDDKVRSEALSVLARCFQPRQWFGDDNECAGDVLMWVYRKNDSGAWEVGYFMPDRTWFPESAFSTKEAAAERVHWLNGGK